MTDRYLEDFAVGQIFCSGRLQIDKERIKTFAAEFGPQPFHLDEEAGMSCASNPSPRVQDLMFKGVTGGVTERLSDFPGSVPGAARRRVDDGGIEAREGALVTWRATIFSR